MITCATGRPSGLRTKWEIAIKTIFNISVLAVLLAVAPSPCFAFWAVEQPVSKEYHRNV